MPRSNSLLSTITSDIRSGRNVDLYLTVASAAIVAVLQICGIVDIRAVGAVLLTLLAILAVSLLRIRKLMQEISASMARRPQREIRFVMGGAAREAIREHLEVCRSEFVLWAINGFRTLPMLDGALTRAVKRGVRVRVLLTEPTDEISRLVTLRCVNMTTDAFKAHSEDAIRTLARISPSELHSNIELRMIEYIPPFVFAACDPHTERAYGGAQLVPYKIPNDERPMCVLDQEGGAPAFEFFMSQFDALWADARPVELARFRNANTG